MRNHIENRFRGDAVDGFLRNGICMAIARRRFLLGIVRRGYATQDEHTGRDKIIDVVEINRLFFLIAIVFSSVLTDVLFVGLDG